MYIVPPRYSSYIHVAVCVRVCMTVCLVLKYMYIEPYLKCNS